jgi:plasmid stabilization system protein ParE
VKRYANIGHPGAPRDDLGRGLRSATYKSFLVVFAIRGKEFRVMRIVRGARDLRSLDFSDDPTT